MYGITDLKVGTAINLDGQSFIITSSHHSKQARGSGVMKTSLKNLVTGATIQKTFQGSDKIEPANTGFSRAQYLYNDGDSYFFMDSTTYEQFQLPKDNLGDQTPYLIEGTDVDIQNIDDNPINVRLKPKMDLEVKHTDPGVRGDTASGGSKPATLETGLVVQVPLFVNIGDKLRINTETGEYCERV
jgi:elongation factor P